MYSEDEYLQLSGIQHFMFCRRQWALIHIEQQWEENFRTADGRIMHENAHDSSFREKRGDIITVRGLQLFSSRLGLSGECDVVEFHRDEKNGVEIPKLGGKYTVVPIEYKRGSPKEEDWDRAQLCAQALCLEDMLCCEIKEGYLFYGETRRRSAVVFDSELRQKTENMTEEMHKYYRQKYTPKVKRTKACNACSLRNICLPVICGALTASQYIEETLRDEL